MVLGEALKSAVQQLSSKGVPSPRLNAELLLMFVIGRERAFLYGHPEKELSSDEADGYRAALEQRSRGIPAQYITGHQEFWGMDLIVSPAVLIPRPETEHVVERALEIVRKMPASPRIIDVGTGSGCIALALAKEISTAEIHAVDISSVASEIARANAARYQLQDRISFHEGDLLAGFEPQAFDLIVSNPPYVGESEAESVQLEVRKFEPRNAVFAGHTGTEVIERLIHQAHEMLKPNGWLVMEISGTIAHSVEQLLSDWSNVEITPDLQGIPRVAAAQRD